MGGAGGPVRAGLETRTTSMTERGGWQEKERCRGGGKERGEGCTDSGDRENIKGEG